MGKWRQLVDIYPEFKDIQDKIERYCEYHEWVETKKPNPNLEKTINLSLYVLSKINTELIYTPIVPFNQVKTGIQFIFSRKPIQRKMYSAQITVEQIGDIQAYHGIDVIYQMEHAILNEIIESIRILKDDVGRPVNKVVFGQVISEFTTLKPYAENFNNVIRLECSSEFRPVTRSDKLERILRTEPFKLDI